MSRSDKPMKNILFVHQAAELYGSDKVLLYLVDGLLSNGRYWPIVVLPQPGPLWDELTARGVEVHVAEVAKVKRSVFTLLGIARLVGQIFDAIKQYDKIVGSRPIAVVHSNTLAVLGGAAWAKRRGVRHLWHVHEIILSPKLVSRAYPWLLGLVADKIMSNSTLTEKWVLANRPKIQARSVVVFNGLPDQPRPHAADVQEFRTSTGAQADDLLIVLAGRLSHWKGQGLLIDAVAVLKKQGRLQGLHFAIVGDTAAGQESIRTSLLDKVAALKLDGAIEFISFVNDIRPVWCAADLAVVPSTEPEPFGMVAIEAMSAGVPVVAAAHGGLLDIVEDGITGLLVEPRNAEALADAIWSLAINPALRRTLGENGLLRQKNLFSARSQVFNTERIYAEMM